MLIAFAVMFSNAEKMKAEPQVNGQWLPAAVLCFAIVLMILVAFKRHGFVPAETVQHAATTHSLATLLLGEMILPFEAVSLVLLAALVGAVHFTRKDKPS